MCVDRDPELLVPAVADTMIQLDANLDGNLDFPMSKSGYVGKH
jgi:hypothetical protein